MVEMGQGQRHSVVMMLEELFPGLADGDFRVTSPKTNRYNCIAWAAGDINNWWWPSAGTREFWPPLVPRERTLSAFEQAFATLGYVACSSDLVEAGFEKVAIFAEPSGLPTHAARQLSNGRWTSKLGTMEDIEHDLKDIEGEIYGEVIRILKRPIT
jgi:hypothetical protein